VAPVAKTVSSVSLASEKQLATGLPARDSARTRIEIFLEQVQQQQIQRRLDDVPERVWFLLLMRL
jgi:mitochondrial fission protein ELM1